MKRLSASIIISLIQIALLLALILMMLLAGCNSEPKGLRLGSPGKTLTHDSDNPVYAFTNEQGGVTYCRGNKVTINGKELQGREAAEAMLNPVVGGKVVRRSPSEQ